MSLPPMITKCSKCNFKQTDVLRPRIYRYVLPRGVIIPILFEKVWCCECDKITLSEVVRADEWIEEIEKAKTLLEGHLKAKQKLVASLSRFVFRKKYQKELSVIELSIDASSNYIFDLEDGLKYIIIRNSLPRCLSCGSQSIYELNVKRVRVREETEDEDGIENVCEHPGCGGDLVSGFDRSRYRIIPAPDILFFDRYGLRIDPPEIGLEFDDEYLYRGHEVRDAISHDSRLIWDRNNAIRNSVSMTYAPI